MAKFRYIGESEQVVVGVAGAVFRKGQIEEVPDERLAGKLRANEFFEEVAPEDVPPVPTYISAMPDQGAPHPDPRVAAILNETQGGGVGPVGNLSRDDQYAANTQAVADQETEAQAAADEGGGEPAPAAKKSKK